MLNAKKRKTECMRHDQRIRHLESKLGRAVSVSEAATVPRKRRITNAARNKHKLKQKARFPAFANWLRFKFKLRPGMHVLDVAFMHIGGVVLIHIKCCIHAYISMLYSCIC